MDSRNIRPHQLSFQVVKDATSQIREMVYSQMRGAALRLVQDLFSDEVERLCGPRFSRKGGDRYHRGGSDPGSVVLEGQRIRVRKPRVKKGGREVALTSHSALQDYDMLCEQVMKHMAHGVSTRNYNPLLNELENGLGLKKSSVSRAFVRGSQKILDELNGRDLGSYRFVAVMLDGIEFSQRTVIAALGVTDRGKKMILGLREGSTENWKVCGDLLQNLIDRGVSPELPLLFVIDGSKALRKAIRRVFGSHHPVQRCIRHKERNCIDYLDKEYHKEFRRRWKRLHGQPNYTAALNDYKRLKFWLGHVNHAALNSLEEAEMETLTVIKLRIPRQLRVSLLSTNPIESAFSKVRDKTNRVKNWRSSSDQVSRWAAAMLVEAEKRFHKITGYKQIPALIAELAKKGLEDQKKVA